MENLMSLILAFISITMGISVCAVMIWAYLLARPIYKADAKITDWARKAGINP
jgi:hypothetical protein